MGNRIWGPRRKIQRQKLVMSIGWLRKKTRNFWNEVQTTRGRT